MLMKTIRLPSDCLVGMCFGLEREGLRVSQNGHISQKRHPAKLGHALTHPFITTDFSEALVELVTPTFSQVPALWQFLTTLHAELYRTILDDDELLWASSMPCILRGDQEIPIADYGHSHAARLKSLYRAGLGTRYGRSMQTIAGVHYNFSFTESALNCLAQDGHLIDRDSFYLGGLRNLMRLGWLLLYLFGASPAVCKTYLRAQPRLDMLPAPETLTASTLYLAEATSLRMSPIGYSNQLLGNLQVSFNTLEAYLTDLRRLLDTEAAYTGPQLNGKLLQIENELYASVRPKQPLLASDERQFNALKRRGIRYLELRLLDLNPFTPLGVTQPQLYFLQTLLVYSLLTPSPPFAASDYAEIRHNNETASLHGRDPDCKLRISGQPVTLRAAYAGLADDLFEWAGQLDTALGTCAYTQAVTQYDAWLQEPELTPSAQFLDFMKTHDACFHTATKTLTQIHGDCYRKIPRSAEMLALERTLAQESLMTAAGIHDTVPFETYLARYLTLEA